MSTTEAIYDEAAQDWQRTGPVLLSDFTARPFLLDWCEPVRGADVLDLGCGEGYVTRQLAARGAKSVLGIDLSSEMIEGAKKATVDHETALEFRVGDASKVEELPAQSYDLVVAVFLFNYVEIDAMRKIIANVRRALRPGGRFIFSVPHPSLPFLCKQQKPFFFDPEGADYFGGRDQTFEGQIWRRDGKSVPVRCVHKTQSDYFKALKDAGFTSIPDVEELRVTDEHVAFDPEFFTPLKGLPLHQAFRVEVPEEV
ncbi:MAG: class I SAM-dependent methyltransferase [Planctomycetota bacterium]